MKFLKYTVMKMEEKSLKRLLFWSCRLFLGIIFLATGTGKALDLPGFIGVMKTYELGMPDWLLWMGGTAVTVSELILGTWILTGWRLRWAALLGVLINSVFLVLLTSALWRGLELQNCGCYGVFLARPLSWLTPLEDLFLIAVSFAVYYLSPEISINETKQKKETALPVS